MMPISCSSSRLDWPLPGMHAPSHQCWTSSRIDLQPFDYMSSPARFSLHWEVLHLKLLSRSLEADLLSCAELITMRPWPSCLRVKHGSFGNASIHNAEHCNDTTVVVIEAVENKKPLAMVMSLTVSPKEFRVMAEADAHLGLLGLCWRWNVVYDASLRKRPLKLPSQHRSPAAQIVGIQAALDDGWDTLAGLGRALQRSAAVDSHLRFVPLGKVIASLFAYKSKPSRDASAGASATSSISWQTLSSRKLARWV